MRTKTIISAAVCLALHASATWSAFHSTDLITDVISGAWLSSLAVVFVLLCRQVGDWTFRLPAFVMTTGYTAFVAYTIWDFFTNAD